MIGLLHVTGVRQIADQPLNFVRVVPHLASLRIVAMRMCIAGHLKCPFSQFRIATILSEAKCG